ncbi:MAG: hypothetical protein EOP49_39425 [Sphingobacteriales bacterium]|nr:MAG: hypothetical protein EOP49_39425 [Sphingobacteriales bacterium]
MKIAILCNDKLAIPAVSQLAAARIVSAVAMPVMSLEARQVLQQVCAQHGVPFYDLTKESLEANLSEMLLQHRPDLVLVKTFPWKIPHSLLSIPRYGFVNFHYAPLPQWAGANPLFWMIRNGATEAGLSVHQMTEAIDCGPLLMQHRFPMEGSITYGMLATRLAMLGAQLTPVFLQQLLSGQCRPVQMEKAQMQWYPRPSASDVVIDWQLMEAIVVERLVRACNPWNRGAAASFKGWSFGITDGFASVSQPVSGTSVPGTITGISDKALHIACKGGTVFHCNIIYTEEGFYTGDKLTLFGIKAGDVLHSERRSTSMQPTNVL